MSLKKDIVKNMEMLVKKMPESKHDCLFSAPLDTKVKSDEGCFVCRFKARKSTDDIFCDGVEKCQYLSELNN